MAMIRTCSLSVSGPGFNVHWVPNIVNVLFGMYFPHKLPMGYANNSPMIGGSAIEGERKENRVLRPEPIMANKLPITQTRIVS
jgi:hypothetical protein